ncbi:MAG TPA: hypothetical protein DHW34_06915 [Actinobacteria bacterium]|nr:hypothetical protein [Actinomycetota bacterium]HCK79728.1 hypothetical protein [Actinomycetota bacterium]
MSQVSLEKGGGQLAGPSAADLSGWPGVLGRLRRADIEVLMWWAVTRIGTLVAVASAAWLLTDKGKPSGALARWRQWDAVNFDTIARFGYNGDGSRKNPYYEAFFPGYPLSLRPLIALGVPATLAGLLITATALAVAVVALRRLADLEREPGVGRAAVIVLLASPWAVFLFAGYSEALFLAFAISAWYLARRGRWWWAAGLAAGAATVRINGLFLAAALIVLFLTRRENRRWDQAPALLLPFFPVAIYFSYLYQRTGDWGRWFTAQKAGWNREFTLPWEAWRTTWRGAFGGGQSTNWVWMWRAELIAAMVVVVVLGWLISRRRWPELTYVGLSAIGLLCSQYYLSIPRSFLLWWPVWIGMGAWLHRHPRWWPLVLSVSVPLQVVLAITFTRGLWAG